jgi:dipeptidyl aminopeptidase/acylaminoacyl peptidase
MRKQSIAVFAVAVCTVVALGSPPSMARPLTFEDFFGTARLSDPQWSPDGKQIAFVVTEYSLETNKGDSDIYVISAQGGPARRLTHSEGRDDQPRFSPDGRWLAFTSARSGEAQIWLLPLEGGEAKQLTTLSTGASSPLWTPDGERLLFVSRVFPECEDDDCNKKRLEEVEDAKVKARVIDELFYVHWDHWRDGRRRHVFVVPADGGKPKDLTPYAYECPTIALGSDHDVAVSPDGTEICVVVNTDKNPAWSTNNDLFVVPITGGTWRRITQNPANDNYPVYSFDGKYIAYRAMTRPGFESDRYRLQVYDRKTDQVRDASGELADKLDRSVSSIAWSPNRKHIFVRCADSGYYSIYRVDARNGKAEKLTSEMYTSSLVVDPEGKRLAFLRQSATMPDELYVSKDNGHDVSNISRINDERLNGVEMNPLETFYFEGAGGDQVQGWLLKPPGFDPSRKYPLIYLVHGGPQGAWGDEFHYRWNYQMFAAPGYVVVAVNPRGSTGFGQEFTDQISGDWGGKVFEDLMRGLDYVVASYPFIDPDRMAAAGASYGGYMMNWFAGHTDRFKCLVNHDGVYNLVSMYGATEELWFPEWEFYGTPWSNPEMYAKWSPHQSAAKFGEYRTPMLIVHGGLDFRVPLAEGMQAFTAMQRQGVPSKFLYFPDEGHFVLKPLNAQLWWKTVHDWIGQWTGTAESPARSPAR